MSTEKEMVRCPDCGRLQGENIDHSRFDEEFSKWEKETLKKQKEKK